MLFKGTKRSQLYKSTTVRSGVQNFVKGLLCGIWTVEWCGRQMDATCDEKTAVFLFYSLVGFLLDDLDGRYWGDVHVATKKRSLIFNGKRLIGISREMFLTQGKDGQHASVFERYQQKSEYFMCSCIGKGGRNVQKTLSGLIFCQRWNNMQFVTSASFLATVYSDYLASSGKNFSGNVDMWCRLSFYHLQNRRSTTFFVTTREPQVTWLVMVTITRDKSTIELPQLFHSRLIPYL
ncbi:hypothetical protein Dsin_007890 [Dipteronia sinensis]|uniref:cellulase n=1 Tax=Dipteronia sinensis TaxID=43782 RepID=A0AAE0B130_9ROSI|nr:hypothetical protein Dsin_007890 [Dipteronia sinensis]